MRPTAYTFALAVVVAAFALALAPAAATQQAATPTSTARQLVNRFFVLLQRKDRPGLQRFLSPAFQVQRADGSGVGKTQYLANLATVNRFTITQLRATRVGATLVVRYLAEVEGLVNGKPYTPGPAPRLSVFVRSGARWQLAAHANFNPLGGR